MPDIAIKDCQKALELLPNNGEAYFYLGRAYALKKDAAQEKANNQKAISLIANRLNIRFNPNTGNLENLPSNSPVLSSKRGVVSINSPSFSYFLYLLGNAYLFDGKYDSAIAAYKKVIEIRPKFPRLRFNLGLSYLYLTPRNAKEKLQNIKESEAQYKALLELDKKLAADLKKAIDTSRRTK